MGKRARPMSLQAKLRTDFVQFQQKKVILTITLCTYRPYDLSTELGHASV